MYDMPESLKRIDGIYQSRTEKASELKSKGQKIIGYSCALIPIEIMSALDVAPYKICGDIREPITEADRLMASASCPIMRSCLDCALKGRNDFLDGLVTIHSSDPGEKAGRIFGAHTHYSYYHFIDMPGTVRSEAIAYFKSQIGDFAKTLEAFTGRSLSNDTLNIAIEQHNRQRSLIQELYGLTKPARPLISGTEIIKVIRAVMTLPVQEGNMLLAQVIDDVRSRDKGPEKKQVRLLIWSSTLDDAGIMQLFEEQANVVYDDTCGGIRPFRGQVRATADPLDGLADYYLKEVTCARTFRQASLGETKKDYTKDLQSRFGYLKQVVDKWRIDGAILLLVRYCDPFAFEIPSIKDYFNNLSVRSLYIEYDYSERALAPLRTRIEAFIDTIN